MNDLEELADANSDQIESNYDKDLAFEAVCSLTDDPFTVEGRTIHKRRHYDDRPDTSPEKIAEYDAQRLIAEANSRGVSARSLIKREIGSDEIIKLKEYTRLMREINKRINIIHAQTAAGDGHC